MAHKQRQQMGEEMVLSKAAKGLHTNTHSRHLCIFARTICHVPSSDDDKREESDVENDMVVLVRLAVVVVRDVVEVSVSGGATAVRVRGEALARAAEHDTQHRARITCNVTQQQHNNKRDANDANR